MFDSRPIILRYLGVTILAYPVVKLLLIYLFNAIGTLPVSMNDTVGILLFALLLSSGFEKFEKRSPSRSESFFLALGATLVDRTITLLLFRMFSFKADAPFGWAPYLIFGISHLVLFWMVVFPWSKNGRSGQAA